MKGRERKAQDPFDIDSSYLGPAPLIDSPHDIYVPKSSRLSAAADVVDFADRNKGKIAVAGASAVVVGVGGVAVSKMIRSRRA